MSQQSDTFTRSPFLHELVYSSYQKARKNLQGHDSVTRDISLTKKLLHELDVTFDQWPRVTVTGSKGKGSTAVFLASILAASGETVGLITSPHLRKFNERIWINGEAVSDEELEQSAHEIAPTVHNLVATIKPPKYLGPGGVILALAAKIFRKRGITALVVEAGRGGEYDEARLIEADVSVITPVMLLHVAKLGPTLHDIVRSKIAITSPGKTIVSGVQDLFVQSEIQTSAKKLQSPVLSVGKDALVKNKQVKGHSLICDIQVENDFYKNLVIPLNGDYQTENAATALLAARELQRFGVKLTKEGVEKGIAQIRWPGRCQVLQKDPWILLDGAINKSSAHLLLPVIKTLPAKQITAVVSIHNPQDLEAVCAEIAKVADKLILTEFYTTGLVWDREAFLRIASKYCKQVISLPEMDKAFSFVSQNSKKDEGIILLGHQTFVSEALTFWNVDTQKLW